jgi:tryptophan synthase alpha chain
MSQNKIDLMFKQLKEKKQTGLFPFITAGYPDINFTEDCIYAMTEAGADLIEIGVPFSDPIADGNIIQESSHIALQNGVNIDKIFDMIIRLRKNGVKIPLVLMSYFNPIYKIGLHNISKTAKEVGVDGFIIPDLLPFETEDEITFDKILLQNDIYQILLASVISTEDRIEKILQNTNGFLYLISKVGTTGESSNLNFELIQNKINFIKQTKNIPVAVGFGVSSQKQVKQLKNIADAIIVGSAIVKIIRDTNNVNKIKSFISELKIPLL